MYIYSEKERQGLKTDYLRVFKWIEDYQSGAIIADRKQYEEKYERAVQLYEIINDL